MNVDRKWTVNPEESKWVKRYSMYEGGQSLKDIKIYLDTNNVKPRRGKFWSLGTLRTILRNKVYIGEYQGLIKILMKNFNCYPQLISHSLFNRVQKTIEKNTKNKGNNWTI